MSKPFTTNNKARAFPTALLLIGLAIMFLMDSWWPGIMLVIGIPLALKQFLQKRFYDMTLSLIVFIGFFIIAQFNVSWKTLMPILLVMAAVYVICNEWLRAEVEEEEDSPVMSTDNKRK